jgi:DNA processing protein
MRETLSPNAKAILLLTAPLVVGRSKKSTDLLSLSEYNKLARHLREHNAQPADLLTPACDDLLRESGHWPGKARLERLLARGFLLGQAVERWQSRAIWAVSRADAAYPRRLKSRLRESAPPVIYGCGDSQITDRGGLAVVGSRNVDDVLIEYTESIGRLAAAAARTVVSGGARGVDQAAMRGALEAGGSVAGVLADSLEKKVLLREHRDMLLGNQLVLISPYDPSAGFNVGHAMQRNKLIYALADAALVVNAERGKGGTWAGATEHLEKHRFVPVFVRTSGNASAGLDALAGKGALPWPEPVDAEGLEAALTTPAVAPGASLYQRELFSAPCRQAPATVRDAQVAAPVPPSERPERAPSDELFEAVRSAILRVVREPMKAAEIARCIDVSETQAQRWLERLVEEGTVAKLARPVRYALPQSSTGARDT